MVNHIFEVKYNLALTDITWTFKGSTQDPKVCKVDVNDDITFRFVCTSPSDVRLPRIRLATLVAESIPPKEGGAGPFGGKKIVDLHLQPKWTVPATGKWRFAICFCVDSEAGDVTFGIVPDPELQVGSTSTD